MDELRSQGLRITPLKKRVIRLFGGGACSVTAAEVHSMAGSSSDLSAVYRCLSSLAGAGFLRECVSEGASRRYRLAGRWDDGHNHLCCRVCGQVLRVPAEISEPLRHRLEDRYGFEIRQLDLSGEGICPACRSRETN